MKNNLISLFIYLDENLTNSKFIDLTTNPERYTGYKAPHAHKIWNSIYRENCFADSKPFPSYGPEVGKKRGVLPNWKQIILYIFKKKLIKINIIYRNLPRKACLSSSHLGPSCKHKHSPER